MDHNALDQSAGQYFEIGTLLSGLQIAGRSALTPRIGVVALHLRYPERIAFVHIFNERVTGLLPAIDPGLGCRVHGFQLRSRNLDRTVMATKSRVAFWKGFESFEIREYVSVRPPIITGFRPGVVIASIAARNDQSIDCAATTQDFSPWKVQHPTIGVLLRDSMEIPIALARLHQREEACGHSVKEVFV